MCTKWSTTALTQRVSLKMNLLGLNVGSPIVRGKVVALCTLLCNLACFCKYLFNGTKGDYVQPFRFKNYNSKVCTKWSPSLRRLYLNFFSATNLTTYPLHLWTHAPFWIKLFYITYIVEPCLELKTKLGALNPNKDYQWSNLHLLRLKAKYPWEHCSSSNPYLALTVNLICSGSAERKY